MLSKFTFVYVYMYAMCSCPRMTERGIGSSGAAIQELLTNSGTQSWVFKINKYSTSVGQLSSHRGFDCREGGPQWELQIL